MAQARLKDVAARADVSVMTVSNVINNSANVRAVTRDKVERAIRELDYKPNAAARHLRRSRSGNLGLAVPDLTRPYFAELAQFIMSIAAERQWTVLVEQTFGERVREQRVISTSPSAPLDGLILYPVALHGSDLRPRAGGFPIVMLGGQTDDSADHVVIDNLAAAKVATQHLIDGGRRRIALIGPDYEFPGTGLNTRIEGYRQVLATNDLAVDRELECITEGSHRATGAAAMEELLHSRVAFDAVLCLSDLLAIGAMKTLREHGVDVPADVAVVGFDDLEEGQYSEPSLTTIAPSKQYIAQGAVDLFETRLVTGDSAAFQTVEAAFELVVRGSSQP